MYEFDVDAILAIVVTGWLFMLPVHCWSTRVKGHRARHLLMGMWSILMLCATICTLVLWMKLGDVPWQYRFCYPNWPDLDSIQNDGWRDSLWQGDWNETIWHTFADPAAYNILIENCLYPCFNTSQVLRQTTSIVASVHTKGSPRTNNELTNKQASHQVHLIFFMYGAISLSALTAVILLIMTITGMDQRLTTLPLHQPLRIWTERNRIKQGLNHDIKNLVRLPRRKRLIKSDREAAATLSTDQNARTRRHKSLVRLLGNLFGFFMLFVVVAIIPATWVTFIIWIEWWIHRDIVSKETPRQVGQWAPAVSVGLILISALIMRLKHQLASKEEVEHEIEELQERLAKLEKLREEKL